MIRSLYGKLALTTISIMVVSGLLAFFISNTYYHQVLKPKNDEKNTEIALEITEYVSEQDNLDLPSFLSHLASVGYQFYLVNEMGEARFFGEPFRDEELPQSTVSSVLGGDIYHGMKQFPRETFVTGFFANELSNTIGVPLNHDGMKYALFLRPDIKLLFNEMHILFAWLLGLTITISIGSVIVSTRYLVKPITTLTEGTRTIADGNLDVSLHIDREDELGELAASFNKMTQQLKQVEHMRTEFMNNVSHDIQSPLSNIKGYTNLLKEDGIDQKTKAKYVMIIDEETERLSHLTEQLLLFSSLKNRQEIVNKRPFNVAWQIKRLIRSKQWLLTDKDIMIAYSLPHTEFIGDEALLLAVWDNLLSNAIKYNRTGGSIDVTLHDKAASVEVVFSDTGIGLTPGEQERLFERFYRADQARDRSVEGSGLGLTIVRMIVELHGGQIDIQSRKGEGTCVTVSLPKG